MSMQQELNKSLIDFNQIKPIVQPESVVGFWNEFQFLYEAPASQNRSKSHTCMFCCRVFARKHDLVRHTRVHTGIKPYRCSYCQKTFARSDARRRHLKSDPFCSKANQLQKIPQQKKEN